MGLDGVHMGERTGDGPTKMPRQQLRENESCARALVLRHTLRSLPCGATPLRVSRLVVQANRR
jgi:hypothetical protein